MLESFIERLTNELQLEPPLEKEKRYQLVINPETLVVLHNLDPGFSLSGQIGPCPLKDLEGLFIYLMKANFLGQGTGGAVIGLDRDEKFLTLSRVLSYDMNYKEFRETIEDFVNYLDYWKEEVIRHQKLAQERLGH